MRSAIDPSRIGKKSGAVSGAPNPPAPPNGTTCTPRGIEPERKSHTTEGVATARDAGVEVSPTLWFSCWAAVSPAAAPSAEMSSEEGPIAATLSMSYTSEESNINR